MQGEDAKTGPASPTHRAVLAAAEGLGVLLEAARRHPCEEPAVRRAAEDLRGSVESAARDLGALTFFFTGQQIRFGTLVLDPDSPRLRETARWFEEGGIQGLSLRSGLTAEDLCGLASILAGPNSEFKTQGLDHCLDRLRIHHIREAKIRAGMVGRAGPDLRRKEEGDSGVEEEAPQVWNLDGGTCAGPC